MKQMSESTDRPGIPASMRQKRILDAASEHPDAAIDTLAEKVPGVSIGLVERVLEDYGDPAITPPAEPVTTDDAPEPLPEVPPYRI